MTAPGKPTRNAPVTEAVADVVKEWEEIAGSPRELEAFGRAMAESCVTFVSAAALDFALALMSEPALTKRAGGGVRIVGLAGIDQATAESLRPRSLPANAVVLHALGSSARRVAAASDWVAATAAATSERRTNRSCTCGAIARYVDWHSIAACGPQSLSAKALGRWCRLKSGARSVANGECIGKSVWCELAHA